MWYIHNCIVYQQIMTTVFSQHCHNTGVISTDSILVPCVSVLYVELHELTYRYCSCCGMKVRSGKLSHSSDVIGACTCICSNVDLHVCVCGSAHYGCMVNGSVVMAAV